MNEISKKGLVLDEAAQALFDQLGGIDRRERVADASGFSSDPLGEGQGLMDLWRIALTDFAYALGQYLSKIKLHGVQAIRAEDVDPIMHMLSKIHGMSHRGGRLLIRYRGMRMPDEKTNLERVDYVVAYENYLVDIPIMKALVNRKGITTSHLRGKLNAAFDRFSSLGINSVCFTFGKWGGEEQDLMHIALQTVGQFFGAYKTGIPLSEPDAKGDVSPSVVYNDKGEPDPNLTLLAAVNGLPPGNIQTLVQKLQGLMKQPDATAALEQYVSAYDALFAFKNVREKLQKPPIEINNLMRLIVGNDDAPFTSEKSEVVRMIAERFSGSPQKLAQAVDSVYGNDFSAIGAENLNARLNRVSHLLESQDKGHFSRSAEKEVLENVEKRLDEVRDDVFKNLTVNRPESSGEDGRSNDGPNTFSGKLWNMVAHFKRRVRTKEKIKEMMRTPIDFDTQDYDAIARDFDISVEAAKAVLELLKGCFDEAGFFLRNAFEKSIPEMAKYGEKIFAFLWHYLKETVNRRDRVAFLNALQSLISEMKQSPAALTLLLKDFCGTQSEVLFSDRNALILANVLLRKYNKEIHNDIEITPEEVLLVREGLSWEAVNAAGDAIDKRMEAFFQKIRTIHGELLKGSREGAKEGVMPLRFLFSLERECYLFLSLIGRHPGHMVLKSAVKSYGNPGSELYGKKRGKGFEEACLKNLRVVVRGLTRFADKNDLSLLEYVRDMETDFLAIRKDQAYRDSVLKAMGWLDEAIRTISVGDNVL